MAARSADAVILSNPCNPTGQGLRREQLLPILADSQALMIIDEAYMDFWDQSLLDQIQTYERLIILKTCSKNFGLAGIRLGFAMTGPFLAGVLRSVKSPYNVSATTQAIGEAVLRYPERLRAHTRRILEAKAYLYARLTEWGQQHKDCRVTDTLTNFVLLALSASEPIHKSLCDQGIAVRKLPGCLRITAGSRDETDTLIGALDKVFAESTQREERNP
jgi:histidinol-phosphate aminotransferase